MHENIKYIRKQDAVDALEIDSSKWDRFDFYKRGKIDQRIMDYNAIASLEPEDVLPYTIDPDGTLTVTVPKGTKRIGRILIEEDGTQYGGLFYPDTGGCFLSSMEKE